MIQSTFIWHCICTSSWNFWVLYFPIIFISNTIISNFSCKISLQKVSSHFIRIFFSHLKCHVDLPFCGGQGEIEEKIIYKTFLFMVFQGKLGKVISMHQYSTLKKVSITFKWFVLCAAFLQLQSSILWLLLIVLFSPQSLSLAALGLFLLLVFPF